MQNTSKTGVETVCKDVLTVVSKAHDYNVSMIGIYFFLLNSALLFLRILILYETQDVFLVQNIHQRYFPLRF